MISRWRNGGSGLFLSVFFLSGFAALIYQVAWQRLLSVYYGVGSISITLIVSIFLLGLGLGGLGGGWLAERVKSPAQLYIRVELCIGLFGLVSPFFLDTLGKATAGSSFGVAALFMFLFLCVPTFLMGMTLPILVKIQSAFHPGFLRTVSVLYFVNTLGAALGSLGGSYILISLWGLGIATFVAAAINFGLALLVWLFAKTLPATVPPPHSAQPAASNQWGKLAFLVVFCTGFLSIGYEIIWFRVVGVLVKDSPYAFSSMLAIYLFGIALGSWGMIQLEHRWRAMNRKDLYLILQVLIAVFVLLFFIGFYYLNQFTPFTKLVQTSFAVNIHPVLQPIGGLKDWFLLLDIFFWPALFFLIPTILMGASFPLISSLALSDPRAAAATIGQVYFVNVLGNVLGGVVTGYLLLPWLKTETILLIFAGVGLVFLLFHSTVRQANRARQFASVGLLALGFAAGAVLFPRNGELYRAIHFAPEPGFESFVEEGREGVVVTFVKGERVFNYINGSSHGGRPGSGFYFRALEAISYAKNAKQVLVIGYGTGTTVEMALRLNEVEHVTLVEINSTLMDNLGKLSLFRQLLADPRLDIILDDGRRFLLRTDQKYDIVLMDPLRSQTASSNNLYSYEFFELVKQHLAPGGVLNVYADEVSVLPRTTTAAFDHIRAYNTFLLTSNDPLALHPERREKLVQSFSPTEQTQLKDLADHLKYLGDRAYVLVQTEGFPINRDWAPISEYFIGLALRQRFLTTMERQTSLK